MPLPPLLHQYSRSKPIFKKKAIANGVAIATVYCNLAIAVHIVLQDTPLKKTQKNTAGTSTKVVENQNKIN